MRQTCFPVLAGALAALAALPAAQAQTTVVLGKPDVESAESFTRISAVRELPAGKVIVADQQDKVVHLVDLVGRSMSKIGREGNGPGEYALPNNLIPLPDGSTLVQDLLNRRFLIIGADGKPGGFVEWPRPPATADEAAGRGPRVLGGGLNNVRAFDERGRLYFSGAPFNATGGSLDSVPIMRWDRVKPTFDTVGYVKLPPNSASSTQSGGNFTMRIGNNKRFIPTETWGIAGDGSIARLIPEPYRVVWLTGRGAPVSGPAIPYKAIPVTEQDKKDFAEQQRRNPGTMIRIGGGGGAGGGGGGGGNITPPAPEFADTKPPFDGANQAALMVAPEGEAWVLRTRPATDKVPTYDVFDKTGALVKKVSLNPNSRVVGFGRGTVYVARTDDDDLQWLQRYRRP